MDSVLVIGQDIFSYFFLFIVKNILCRVTCKDYDTIH